MLLHNFVKYPFTDKANIDYESLENSVATAVRFLDNIIEINKFPDEIYENYQKAFRTIGLGITGLADMLTMLGFKYNSKEACMFVDELMNGIAYCAYKASIDLAKEKSPFPFLHAEKFIDSGFLTKHSENSKPWESLRQDILKYGIRNAKILSIAPTGTMSLTFGNNCSSGCEPIFSLEYDRKVKMGGQNEEHIQIVKMQDYAYKLWKATKIDNVVPEDVFVTAMNMSVQDHVDMLKVIAYHTDMSVSKTINVPSDYSFEDTKKIYDECWKSGIKGCTIFRPNEIRQGILISEKPKEETPERHEPMMDIPWGTTLEASDELIGRKKKIMSGCGAIHVQAWFDSFTGRLLEVYLSKGSQGGCNSFMISNSRMISLALRSGASFEYVIDQLKSAPACPSYAVRQATKKDTSKGSCCPSAVANVLVEMQNEIYDELGINEEETVFIKAATVEKKNLEADFLSEAEREYINKNGEIPFAKKFNKCPNCGEKLENVDGCISCYHGCGWSKCG